MGRRGPGIPREDERGGDRIMDDTDRILLQEVQRRADRSNRELGEQVGLTAGAVHKRLKRLREAGYIRTTAALVDRDRVGLDLLCFLRVRFRANMMPGNVAVLREALAGIPDVLECYTTTGADDALLKVVVRDHDALKALLERIARSQDVIERTTTALALEEIKNVHELPIERRAAADPEGTR